jgi:acyl-CoA reductase-like NAD-dependent aldehyde dehydrogenase
MCAAVERARKEDDVLEAPMIIGGKALSLPDTVVAMNPARLDEAVGRFPQGTEREADAAVAAAAAALAEWRAVPVAERAERLVQAGNELHRRADEWQADFTREHGKTLVESGFDLQVAGDILRYYGSHPEFLDEQVLTDFRGTLRVRKQPLGVCAAIVPWNWPVALSAMKIGPALLAGNTLVLKAPDHAALTMLLAVAAVAECFPPGVVNVISGQGPALGRALVRHPGVVKVTLTGGTATGKAVAADAAESLKRVTLELGGNDPAILLADVVVDENLAENIVLGALTTAGQICFAIKRLFVPRALYGDVVDLLRTALDDVVVGDGLHADVRMGPVNNARQYKSVTSLIDRSRRAGLTVDERGVLHNDADPERGYFIRPHLVLDPPDEADVVSCEQFGPVLPVLAYDTEDEALARANATPYGLCSSLWTSDEERAFSLCDRIEAGTTFINGHSVFNVDLDAPFGGVKESGYGRELSAHAVDEYTRLHAVTNKRL